MTVSSVSKRERDDRNQNLLEDLLDCTLSGVSMCKWALENLVQGQLTQHHSAQNHGNTLSRGSKLHARVTSKNKATGALSTCSSDQEVKVWPFSMVQLGPWSSAGKMM